MATENCLDAHTLIWHIGDNTNLGANANAILNDPKSRLYVPVIALAEVVHIVGRGRTVIPSVSALLSDLDADPRIIIVPLDRAIINLSLTLTAITEMHDRLIVATTLSLSTPGDPAVLLTHDANITNSGLVPIVW